MSQRVCVVTGVGPGTGAALVRRFAADGYRVAMLARDARAAREARGRDPRQRSPSPSTSPTSTRCARRSRACARELGAPTVLLHNAVAGGFGTFDTVKPEDLERASA